MVEEPLGTKTGTQRLFFRFVENLNLDKQNTYDGDCFDIRILILKNEWQRNTTIFIDQYQQRITKGMK